MCKRVAVVCTVALATLLLSAELSTAQSCTAMCDVCKTDKDCCQATLSGELSKCVCRPLPGALAHQDREANVMSGRCQCLGDRNLHRTCTEVNYVKMVKVEAQKAAAAAAAAKQTSSIPASKP